MRNYKLTINYDGSRYQGWQRQPNVNNTIQGILERTIGEMTGYPVEVNGSGRTDGGVHAYAQTASMNLSGKIQEEEFQNQLNEKLPDDIRICEIILVKNGFHARRNATSKCYEYHIDMRDKGDVFQRKYCWHLPKDLDIESMEEAAGYLIGRHEFMSFSDRKEDGEKTTVRTIYDISFEKKENILIISYVGSGFLYHMVRILTGTLTEIGAGERAAIEIPAILDAKARNLAGGLAPACGLFLKEVYYE